MEHCTNVLIADSSEEFCTALSTGLQRAVDGGDGTARETKRRLREAGLLEEGEGSLTIENSKNSERLIPLSWELLR